MQDHQKKIDKLRAKSEASYIFACQASVPLIINTDLLYQLWNNFKQYQYSFEPNEHYKIPHIAVSDFLLSDFCKEVGVELFEIEKKVRDVLLTDLELLLGKKRKNTIAAFLEDYALIDYKYSHRKNLKDIHILTAQSILDPTEMEKQIIERINKSESDYEKLNYLFLHNNLLPVGLETELSKITKGLNSGDLLSPVLLEEENENSPNILNVNLPAILTENIRRTKRKNVDENVQIKQIVVDIIIKSAKDKVSLLDLGNLGLVDNDFNENSVLNQELRKCIYLETLILSNSWSDFLGYNVRTSKNKGPKNTFNSLPSGISSLSNLSVLICCGEQESPWNINDILILNDLRALTYIDLSWNAISEISKLNNCPNLQTLLLGHNYINQISEIGNLQNLYTLDLEGNKISDIKFLIPLLSRTLNPMKLTLDKIQSESDNVIGISNNPIINPPLEIIQKGNKAIFSYFEQTDLDTQLSYNAKEWLQIRVKTFTSEKLVSIEFSARLNNDDYTDTTYIDKSLVNNILAQSRLIPEKFTKIISNQDYNIIWILDKESLIYPWEKLSDNFTSANTFFLKRSQIRQIATQKFRSSQANLAIEKALIIADPNLEEYSMSLDNAVHEGKVINKILRDNGFETYVLVKSHASEILEKFYENTFKIIHIAGHGVFFNPPNNNSDIAIGKNRFLNVSDFLQLKFLPELVFINCADIGKSNFAAELLEIGVRAIIVFRDSLKDDIAYTFSTAFYQNMIEGKNFSEAAFEARLQVYRTNKNSSDLESYQFYGDPFYKFKSNKNLRKKVYISSTYIDFKDYREKIYKTLNQTRLFDLMGMEYFNAADISVVDKIVKDVAECDIFILMIGNKYGSVPKGYDKSFQEIEYETADIYNKQILTFVLDNFNELSDIRLDSFKRSVMSRVIVQYFKSYDELTQKILDAVLNIVQRSLKEFGFKDDSAKASAYKWDIFISYSNKDKYWLDKILSFLRLSVAFSKVGLWSDSETATDYRTILEETLVSTKIFLCIVTPNFLTSTYFTHDNLSYFIQAAYQKDVRVTWIAASHSNWHGSPLSKVQCANNPSFPLDEMSENSCNSTIADICNKLEVFANKEYYST